MEEKKAVLEKEIKDVRFENVDIGNLDEMEEVVTPGWGTVGCCTQ